MGAYLSKPNTEKVSTDTAANGLRVGASSMQGWRLTQEDAHNSILDFDTGSSYFAVYDGHGGAEVAQYCAVKLPEFIKRTPAYKTGNYNEALQRGFVDFDATLTEDVVIQELAQIAGVDLIQSSEEEEEEGKKLPSKDTTPQGLVLEMSGNGVAELLDEACMPLDEVMAKYEMAAQCPKLRRTKMQKRPGKNIQQVMNGMADNDNNKNHEREHRLSHNGDSEPTSDGDQESAEVESEQDDGALALKEARKAIQEIKEEEQESREAEEKTGDEEEKKAETEEENQEPNQEPEGKEVDLKTEKKEEKEVQNSGSDDNSAEAEDAEADVEADEEADDEEEDEEEEADEEEEEEEEEDAEEGKDEEDDDEDFEGEEEEEDSSEEEGDGAQNGIPLFGGFDDTPGVESGCTAVVAMLKGDELMVANAGDSRCVLCRGGHAYDLSRDHKPDDAAELERITRAGGKVTAEGRVNGGLNLSRAIGDHLYKRNTALSLSEQMISAFPDIQTTTLTSEDSFLVLACDGIWNSMTSEEVVQFINERIQANPEGKLSAICEELFDRCMAPDTTGDGTGCDNMTAIIVMLGRGKRAADDDLENPSKRLKIPL